MVHSEFYLGDKLVVIKAKHLRLYYWSQGKYDRVQMNPSIINQLSNMNSKINWSLYSSMKSVISECDDFDTIFNVFFISTYSGAASN